MLFYSIRKDASQKAWQDQQMLKKNDFLNELLLSIDSSINASH